jgi:hypothetical protein
MTPLCLPFWKELEPARNVLIAGAGGGFDVFCGLPLYFALRNAGKQVQLANLTFSDLHSAYGRRMTRAVLEVTADTVGEERYFPELHLARWFRGQGEEVAIYAVDRTGVQPVLEGYRELAAHYQIDTVILVDGGTDSLMRGDEMGLGTPEEDMTSIAAADELAVERKFLVASAFGVDAFHGVCHAHALEAVAELTRAGAFLGAFTLLPDMPEVQRYREAALAVFRAMPDRPSIVSCSVLSAVEGNYGDHHMIERTRGSTLYINPLMTLYWCFRLDAVARRVLYLEALKQTQTVWEVHDLIFAFSQARQQVRDRLTIPDASLGRGRF